MSEFWEIASYVVTVIGLPLAILVFLYEQRKERDNEDEEAYQMISDAYKDFLRIVLDNSDLRLRTERSNPDLSPEQHERMMLIFDMLISLFERAYLVLHEPDMNERQRRRWASWEDYMHEWCRREDFRTALPLLLRGEDAEFVAHIKRIADEELSAALH
ncbi:MAG: hypothetical protein RL341_235 [Pseudomonadota bacterium]|jgi:hypothetical protein